MIGRRLEAIQNSLRDQGLDGWLFYDFRGSDPLAHRILGLAPGELSTRRWYYFVRARGAPVGLVSTVEPHRLDGLPGRKLAFLSWEEHRSRLAEILGPARRIAMQYSPENAIPYVSRVDAGTIELVRELGLEVVSSADLVQRFEAVLAPAQRESHLRAARAVREIVGEAFAHIARAALAAGRARGEPTEYGVQQFILERFAARGLITSHPPVVAVNAHSADPHYSPAPTKSAPIRRGDFVLIDLWAREPAPEGVYGDITWVGFLGPGVPARHREVFSVARRARDRALTFIKSRVRKGRKIRGYEVDRVARRVIAEAGFGGFIRHRTGHSIGDEVHGSGANLDDLETHDERELLAHTCFSVEPGIYLPGEFGVRTEVNVYLTGDDAVVTGEPRQKQVLCLLR